MSVFLWVVLVVKTLIKARDEGETKSRMLEIVHDLPNQLNDLITQIVKSLGHGSSEDAIKILQWITFSTRPMSTTELRYALEASRTPRLKSQGQMVSSPTFVNSNSQLEKVIRARTKGLAEVKRYSPGTVPSKGEGAETLERVGFIHGSIGDFMLHHQGFQILDSSMEEDAAVRSHRQLADSCINYIGCEDIRNSVTAIPEAGLMTQPEVAETLGSLYQNYPFLEYAIDGTMKHIEKAQQPGPSAASSEDLMASMQSAFGTWRKLADLDLARNYNELRGRSYNFAHVAAEHGISNWVMELLRQAFDVNSTGGRHHTLLGAASVRGHESLVKQLIGSGADVNIEGGRYGNALSAAASSGNAKVLQIILEESPDVNAIAGECGTALQTAAQVFPENEELIALLLAANAAVNTQEGLFGDALQASAFIGNRNILTRLIDAGANIDAQ